jgi:D-sedoheptulose 7-phosphate isomerase
MSVIDIRNSLVEAQEVLDRFIKDEENLDRIYRAAQIMAEAIHQGGKIITCGNGGSMSDAMHFAEELTGRFRDDRRGLPAVAISDPTHITCVANDYGFDHVFSRYVEATGSDQDVLLGISTSGHSANVLKAACVARKKGMKVVALTGKSGGELKDHCDVELRVPHNGYSDRIQEVHIKVIHILIQMIEQMVEK